MIKYEDLSGIEFGFVKVDSLDEYKNSRPRWNCTCLSCGSKSTRSSSDAKLGRKCRSCAKKLQGGDFHGVRFGMLTAISISENNRRSNHVLWDCKCDCGKHRIVLSANLSNGIISDCGCVIKNKIPSDMIGNKFGRLTVLSYSHKDGSNRYYWNCVCDCGKPTTASGSALRFSRKLSCGCLAIETVTTHGMSNTKTYKAYRAMLARCYSKNFIEYSNYGGRGISVSEDWLISFENFFRDMGKCPDGRYSLDRINVDNNYGVENCKWSTDEEQANNKTNNINILYNNDTLTLAQWCKRLGLSYSNTWSRLYVLNWSVSDAFEKPKL